MLIFSLIYIIKRSNVTKGVFYSCINYIVISNLPGLVNMLTGTVINFILLTFFYFFY